MLILAVVLAVLYVVLGFPFGPFSTAPTRYGVWLLGLVAFIWLLLILFGTLRLRA